MGDGGVLLRYGGAYEKGHGSAEDMAKRNWVRQISERDVGMFDMVVPSDTPQQLLVFHSKSLNSKRFRKLKAFIIMGYQIFGTLFLGS